MSEKGKGKPRLDNCAFVTQNSKERKWEYLLIKAATRGVVCEKVFLEIKKKSQENTCSRVSFIIKLQA